MFLKFIVKFILAISFYVGLEQLIELKTHGFCLQKIKSDDLPYLSQWETLPLNPEEEKNVDHLLSQSYRMIGAGSECFAFVSEDGNAVIKFFKLNHTRPIYFHRGMFLEDHSAFAGTLSNHPLTRVTLPSVLQEKLKRFLGIREFRITRTFSSLKLAYDALKDETGLIYLHLNPTDHLKRSLTIYDTCGITHQIDLDTAKFFLQKKAIPLKNHFADLSGIKAEGLAKESIDSFIKLIVDRCKKGFADRDIVNRNFGFIGTQAIEIDSGSFFPKDKMREPWIYKQELFYATLELKEYLKTTYPEMVEYLEERVSKEIDL